MLTNVDSTEQLIVLLANLGVLLLKLFYTLLPPNVYMRTLLYGLEALTTEQIAAELPGLHG